MKEKEMKDMESKTAKLATAIRKETTMDKRIRVLLVEHNELIRYGLLHMLKLEGDIEVVGDCSNAEEALSKAAKLSPDIVLMDNQTPLMNGIEATRHLKRNSLNHHGAVIMLADSAHCRSEAINAGAASYLLKDVSCSELLATIREVYQSRRSSDADQYLIEEIVDLVIPPSANGAQLLGFVSRLEDRLNDKLKVASVVRMIGDWDWGVVITLTLRFPLLDNLAERLENMPEVDRVEEESLRAGANASFPRRFQVIPRSNTASVKRIRITLKETGVAEQEAVAA
ncbi:MAG: response regulator transcription factor [Chloroflexi bacterium]|nr:response regulator transcription factor [Chloroflexota bacterium]